MPTTEQIHDKFSTIMGLYSTSNQEIGRARAYYNREFGDEIVPPQWQGRLQPLIPQTARRAIDDPSDHLLTTPYIKIPVRPTLDDSLAEELRAEVVRQACNAWWGVVANTYNLLGDARKPLLNEGKVAIRKTIRWDLVPTYPKKSRNKTLNDKRVREYRAEIDRLGRSEFLWDIQLLDNITVFEDPSNHRDPNYVFCSYRIYLEDAKTRWPDAKGNWRDGNDLDMVTYTEYWSKPGHVKGDKSWEPGRFVQWIEDAVVHDADNPYPYIPITIDDPGFGLNHHLAKPEEIYVGMTAHARQMFRAQAKSMTAWAAIEDLAAFPIGITRNLPDDKNITIAPGELVNLEGDAGVPGSETLEWLQHPDVPAGVVALDERINVEANSTFKMDILSGVAQRGVDTATEADLNIRNAVSKLSGPVLCMERVCRKLTRQFLMDVELVLRAPVTLYGTSKASSTPAEIVLKPTDINGYYEVFAQITTSDQETLQAAKARLWAELPNSLRGLSSQTAMERGEIVDDPVGELTRWASEQTFFSEPMTMMRDQAAAADMGMELQAAQSAQTGMGDDMSLSGPSADARLSLQLPSNVGAPQQAVIQNAYANRDAAQGMI